MKTNTPAIRPASKADIPTLLDFLHKKGDFDRSMGAFSSELEVNKKALEDTLFNKSPYAYAILAEAPETSNEKSAAKSTLGFATYHFRYSTFKGRPSLWLDDLLVLDTHRSQGIGRQIMASLVEEARKHNCTHIGWTASVNNTRGLKFYEAVGATVQEKKEKQFVLNLDESKFKTLTP